MYIKKGDKVKILRGREKGKEGTVLQVVREKERIVIEGVNMRFRHLRPRRSNEKGQRVEFPAPMHVSNVMLICPETKKPTRIRKQKDDSAKKVRIAIKSGKPIKS